MSTRALIKVFEGNTKICTIYKQSDGYPEGLGAELHRYLSEFTVGNGITGNEKEPYANGMGCLTAQIIARLKVESGEIYIIVGNDATVDYVYEIGKGAVRTTYGPFNKIGYGLIMKVLDGNGNDAPVLFNGAVGEFGEYLENRKKEQEYE